VLQDKSLLQQWNYFIDAGAAFTMKRTDVQGTPAAMV
jgi:hypothetical protein